MRLRTLLRGFVVSLLVVLMVFVAFAHPGRTDASGGHKNHSTGDYHYHHGYPAHYHKNGICEYDFDDKTGWSSGKNPSGQSSASNTGSGADVVSDTRADSEKPEAKQLTGNNATNNESDEINYAFFWLVIPVAVLVFVLDRRKKRLRYVKLFGGKSCRELAGVPPGEDPAKKVDEFRKIVVYTSGSGQAYHEYRCRYVRYPKSHCLLVAAKTYRPCKWCRPLSKYGKFGWVFRYDEYMTIKRKYRIPDPDIK